MSLQVPELLTPMDAPTTTSYGDRWVGCLKVVTRKPTWQQAVTANRVRVFNPSSSDGIKDLGVIEAPLGPAGCGLSAR
jgi:hypothetical protein